MSQAGKLRDGTILDDIETLTGDVGAAVGPDAAFNIDLLGGANITTTGTPNTITIDVTGTTDRTVQVGNASGSLTSLGAGTTGELLIGNTGADPAFGSTAYADFSFSNVTGVGVPRSLNVINTDVNVASYADLRISVPPLGGDGMVSWEVQGTLFYAMGVDNSDSDIWKLTTSSDPSSGTTAIAVDNGTAAVKFANAYEFPIVDGAAAEVLTTNGAGVVSWQPAAGGGLTWEVTTVNDSIVAGEGYHANKGTLLTMTLPATAAIGDTFAITNMNIAVGWRIAQNAAGYIRFGNQITTVGVGGYLEATQLGDSVTCVCNVENNGWIMTSSVGNITVN